MNRPGSRISMIIRRSPAACRVRRALQKRGLIVSGLVALVVGLASAAAGTVVSYDFATPLFGLAVAPDGSLLVADAGAGIVELRKGVATLIAELPGVTDVAPIGRGNMYATRGVTAPGEPGELCSASRTVRRGRSPTSTRSNPTSILTAA